jgi:hypothetical protein
VDRSKGRSEQVVVEPAVGAGRRIGFHDTDAATKVQTPAPPISRRSLPSRSSRDIVFRQAAASIPRQVACQVSTQTLAMAAASLFVAERISMRIFDIILGRDPNGPWNIDNL